MTPSLTPRDELLVRLAELVEVFDPRPTTHCDVPGCVHCAAAGVSAAA